MSKRFTNSCKWNEPFLRNLKPPYKLLWIYINDECDHAGIWQVDIDVAKIKMGISFNICEAVELFGERIIVFCNGEKWFIPEFIEFQYGFLNPENRAHKSVIDVLRCNNLVDDSLNFKPLQKPLVSPLIGATDKDKDKDMDKVAREPKLKIFTPPTVEEVIDYFSINGYSTEIGIKAFDYYVAGNWFDSKGQKIKNWKQKMQGVWFRDEHKKKVDTPAKKQETPEEYKQRKLAEMERDRKFREGE